VKNHTLESEQSESLQKKEGHYMVREPCVPPSFPISKKLQRFLSSVNLKKIWI